MSVLDTTIFSNILPARKTPFEPTADIPETDTQRAIEQVQENSVTDLAAVAANDFLVKTASATLSAERAVTDTATIAVDWATAGQAKFNVVDDSITDAKLRNSAAVSVIGRSANSAGDPADIAAAGNDTLLRRVSDALGFGELTVGMFPNDVVTYAKIQNVSAQYRLLGRSSSGAGDIEEITTTSYILGLLDDPDAATARTSLGLGTAAVKNTGTSGDAVPLLNTANAWSGRQSSTGAVTGNNAMNVATGSLGEFEVTGNGTGAAMMAFHRPGTFAAYLGLDTDNVWKVGGWSMGATASAIAHAGNLDDTLEYSGSSTFQRAALTGDVTAPAGSNATTIANDAVTYAKIQNVTASRILGRTAGTAGDTEELTITQALDLLTSTAQGDIIYRGASAWARLAADTTGKVLTTKGAGANPAWELSSGGGISLLDSGTVSAAATLDIVLTSYTAYRGLTLLLMNFRPATDSVDLWLRFSTDGGSNYLTTNYSQNASIIAGGVATPYGPAAGQIELNRPAAGTRVGNATTEGISVIVNLLDQAATAPFARVHWNGSFMDDTATSRLEHTFGAGGQLTAGDVDALRIAFSSGNITSGKWALYGYA